MQIGFHTDAFNSSYRSFEDCLAWAERNGVRFIECGLIDGVSWIHGLGYQPHVALYEDPVLLRRKMEGYGVRFSQVDAAYPLSGADGLFRGVPYVLKAIAWAAQAGAPRVATTDGLRAPAGLADERALDLMRIAYDRILETAEAHGVTVTIETHGYFTTDPDKLAAMLDFGPSDRLRLNLDTGNTFIAGRDPVAFLGRFLERVEHVHIKDVSASLAASARGGQTGIAVSHCAIGDGVNASNIRACIAALKARGYDGVLSMECEGAGGPMIERSLSWLRDTLDELGVPEEAEAALVQGAGARA